ncbi:MAG: Omp28-related outer membrane protein [Sphingobacteriales bacterium]|nr:MAG: Omp28-related outer membrane protein [Sphingobacteriales bacterium]
MKKTLLLSALLAGSLITNAQQRMVLYEEFSGENCAPCAATNPGLWTLLTTGTNPSRVMLIKYQVPIPTAGPIYYQNTVDPGARRTYYGVSSAPNARMDGLVSPGAGNGHPGYLTQAFVDAATAINAPFNISVTNSVSGTNLTSTVNVSAVAGYTGTTVKLRAALVETLIYDNPPGTNGETDFHHVVRKMYPSADGQAIPNTWTTGQTGTYTVTGTIPSYVDRTHELFVVVWIQDDGDKKIAQTAKSSNVPLPLLDGAIVGATPGSGTLYCTAGTQTRKVTLKNTGTNTMTSADMYYRTGTGAYQASTPPTWTGSLAPGATAEVTVGSATLTEGTVIFTDSVGSINAQAEVNPANSAYSSSLTTFISGGALPMETGFESGMAPGYVIFNNQNKVVAVSRGQGGNDWFAGNTSVALGPDNSTWACAAPNFNSDPGYTSVVSFPYAAMPAGAKAVDFYYAHALRGAVGDKLDLVYSTDCGQSWTSLWSKEGSELATAPAISGIYIPKPTEWKFASVSVDALSGNALVGFRTTSNGGNYIFVDKVQLRTGAVNGIEELVNGGNVSLYPNPATVQVTVEMNMAKSAKVSFRIVNMLGQQVGQQHNETLGMGQSKTVIATSDLAPGVYFMNIATEKGNLQQKFVKQ